MKLASLKKYLEHPSLISDRFWKLINPLCSDRLFVEIDYYRSFHRKLNLKNPTYFSEKLQWLKLYDRNPDYTIMADKARAKDYVSKKTNGECKTIPTIGLWKSAKDINIDELPDRFVLKCNHNSGAIWICHDKNTFDLETAQREIEENLRYNYYYSGREWPYKNIEPCVLAEPYIEEASTDYKFYCFGGTPRFLYVSTGLANHDTARISFITLDWQFAPFIRNDFSPFEELPPKPSQLDRMITLAEELSKGIPFVRVDLYQIGNSVYFSELTFFPCSGMMHFHPDEWDRILGGDLSLPIHKQ